jgi:hypothetical protein
MNLMKTHRPMPAHKSQGPALLASTSYALRINALVLACALVAANAGQAQEFLYQVAGNSVTITQYVGTATSVAIPATIEGLPVSAIRGIWTNVVDLAIPSTVSSIETSAFYGWNRLTAIEVDPLNSSYSSADGVLFDKSQTTLIAYPAGKQGDYVIPMGVTTVGDYAFQISGELTGITIPGSVKTIGWNAFFECFKLGSVSMSDGLTEIGESAFMDCPKLTSLQIPNTVMKIGSSAFAVTGLTNITIPNSITDIGDSAFYSTPLSSVVIPASVKSVGRGTFAYSNALTNITVDAQNTMYSTVGGVLFDKAQSRLIGYPGGRTGAYEVPPTVSTIGESAFAGCTNLTAVALPPALTTIDYQAFVSCTNLTSVIIPSSVTFIDGEAFAGCFSLKSVYFEGDEPSIGSTMFTLDDQTTIYYLPGTRGWSTTFASRPTAPWLQQAPVILHLTGAGSGVNGFGFTVSWTTNKTVIVETSTDLLTSAWLPASTNTLVDGSFVFTSSKLTTEPKRFYRIRSL